MLTMGQRKFMRGLMTNFQATAVYAPYVDAMFIERECAFLVEEGALRRDLQYRARVYSYANKDAFVAYAPGGRHVNSPVGVREQCRPRRAQTRFLKAAIC
jgi:hypothetical protein